jgi:hypothetical protein
VLVMSVDYTQCGHKLRFFNGKAQFPGTARD